MSDKTTLLPCPFCGGEAHVIMGTCEWTDDIASYTYSVICNSCHTAIFKPRFNEDTWNAYKTHEQAIEAWNTRTERTCTMETDEGSQNWSSCSVCHNDYYNDQPLNYCPNCGARVEVDE